jgi:hypothetical protein
MLLENNVAVIYGGSGARNVVLRPTGMPDSVELGSVMGEMWRKAASRLGMPFEELLEQDRSGKLPKTARYR